MKQPNDFQLPPEDKMPIATLSKDSNYNDINQINKQNLNIEVNDSSNQNNEIISNDEELNFNINTTSNKDNIFK